MSDRHPWRVVAIWMSLRVLEGVSHNPKMKLLAPVVVEFLTGNTNIPNTS